MLPFYVEGKQLVNSKRVSLAHINATHYAPNIQLTRNWKNFIYQTPRHTNTPIICCMSCVHTQACVCVYAYVSICVRVCMRACKYVTVGVSEYA